MSFVTTPPETLAFAAGSMTGVGPVLSAIQFATHAPVCRTISVVAAEIHEKSG